MVWDRWHTVRVELADGRAVVVKRPRRDVGRDQAPSDEARRRFANERASLALLAASGAGVAPELLGASDDPELLVMEALAPGRSLAELLLGSDGSSARDAIRAFARALATMHVSTIGREPSFAGVVSSPWVEWTASGVDGLVAVASDLGLDHDADAVRAECATVISELGEGAGPWRAFVHGDPCPDNTRVQDGSGRFRIFDFEISSYGHALTDASYVLAPFPTCWCVGHVPDDLGREALDAYRSVLGEVVSEASDDEAWNAGLAVALAVPVISRGGVLAKTLVEDHDWGTTGLRPRLRRWTASFLAAADASGRFPALRQLADALATDLAHRWPDADLPDYPALPTGAATVAMAPEWWTPDA